VIQWAHHREVLFNVVQLSRICDRSLNTTVRMPSTTSASGFTDVPGKSLAPNLSGCYSVPWGCGYICILTCGVVWGGACHIYFDYVSWISGLCLVLGCFICIYLIAVVSAALIKRRKDKVRKDALRNIPIQQDWNYLDDPLLDVLNASDYGDSDGNSNSFGGGSRRSERTTSSAKDVLTEI